VIGRVNEARHAIKADGGTEGWGKVDRTHCPNPPWKQTGRFRGPPISRAGLSVFRSRYRRSEHSIRKIWEDDFKSVGKNFLEKLS
jgi:hypothetical protein